MSAPASLDRQARVGFSEACCFLSFNRRPSLRFVLDMAEVAVVRENARILQIDPWNKLEADRPPDMRETEWIGQCLDELIDFARDLNGL